MHSVRQGATSGKAATVSDSQIALIVKILIIWPNDMSITAKEIAWVAKLSRLELTPDELVTYSEQLRVIVDYIDLLNAVDTEGVLPLAHPIPVENVFREDGPQPSLPPEEALQNAPQRKDNFFSVPAVLE